MADYLDQFKNRPTRLILRSDTIENWLSTASTSLMYGEIGVGYDKNGTGVIVKIGSIKESTGQKWSDAPQIGGTADETGLNLEEIGRVYSSVVVDSNNQPITTFGAAQFYDTCSSNIIEYLYGDLSTLPHSLKCGTDNIPPDVAVYLYNASAASRNYIVPSSLSGWNTIYSSNMPDPFPDIFAAPVGFVHPEFGNVLSCDASEVINNLPIQPIQTPLSVLAWLEDVEMWTIPVSPIEDEQTGNSRNTVMAYRGKVSGWFPFPYRQFLCDGDIYTPPTDGFTEASLNCTISLGETTDNTDITGEAGTGSFTISAQDTSFTCDDYAEYCEQQDICGTCMNWDATVIDGKDWLSIRSITRNTEDCEPSTGTLYYGYTANDGYNAAQRTGTIRVYMRPTAGDIPSNPAYQDFTFTQDSLPCSLVRVSPTSLNIGFNLVSEREFTVTLQNSNCTYTATTTDDWITIEYGTDNTFTATFAQNIDTDGSSTERTGTITVTDTSPSGEGNSINITILQAGNECIVDDIQPRNNNISWDFDTTDSLGFGAENPLSPTYSIDVNFLTEDEICSWTGILSRTDGNFDSNWLTITNNATGTGSEIVEYESLWNPSIEDRQMKISILDGIHTVTQTARPCTIESLILSKVNEFPNFASCGSILTLEVDPYECETCNNNEVPCSWKVDLTDLDQVGDNSGTYEWVRVVGVGNDITATDAPTTIITGKGYIRVEADQVCGACGSSGGAVGDGREVPIIVVPITKIEGQVNIEYTDNSVSVNLIQYCNLPNNTGTGGECCACEPDSPGCPLSNCNPDNTEAGCLFYYYDPEEDMCKCACDSAGTPPNAEGLCNCCTDPNDPTCNLGEFCPPPTAPLAYYGDSDGVKPTGFSVVSEKSSGLVTVPGIIEIDVLKIANSFVKIKGYLNPGVSPVWNDISKAWEPKQVPNFYANELVGLENDGGYVYYDINDNSWKISNVIDGGNAF